MKRPYKVLFDPGHGGSQPGAVAVFPEVKEKDINLAIARLIRRYARKNDLLFKPILTRRKDKTLSLADRVEKNKKKKPDLFVSLHCNSYHDPEVSGIEVYYKKSCPDSRYLAGVMQNSLMEEFPGHKNRGAKSGKFHVLRSSPVPAILIEYEFLSDPLNASFLVDEWSQRRMAVVTVDTLELYLEGGGI